MDWEAREAAWKASASAAFVDTIGNCPDSNFARLSMDLMAAQKHGIRLLWNIRCLEEYFKLNLVPRGLRIPIFPAWEPSVAFRTTWEEGLLRCSQILINMLIAHDRELLVQVKTEIRDLENGLSKFDEVSQIQPFKIKLKEGLDKYDKEIMDKKRAKFLRDKLDFDQHMAYKWGHQGNQRRGLKTRQGPTNSSRNITTTEGPSSSDFFVLGGKRHRTRTRTRRGHRRRRPNHSDHQEQGIQTSISQQTDETTQVIPSSTNSDGESDVRVKHDSLQIVNLSQHQLTPIETAVLSRGLTFSPAQRADNFTLIKDLFLFCRKIVLQVLHIQPQAISSLDQTEHGVFQDLMELLQEGESNTVQFLDLEVKCQNGKLSTCLYRKPTAVNSLLEYRSFHPKHTRDGIPRGQFLRARRNCTDDEDFRREAHDLTERFRRRNYPKKCISRAYQRAKIQTQDTLLVPTKKETDKFVRFITGYHTQWNQVRDILNNHWRILTADTQTAQVISPRPLVTAKRAPNFRDILTRSHYSRPTHKLNRGIVLKGSFPCGNCTVCTYMHPTRDSFINPTDQTPHRLKSYINCKTSNVIYAIICTCPRVYVGQTTQELRRRIQGHFSTINTAVADRRKGFLG
ncbi:uncharacterized protein [Ranitomeya imitator]|uniref:uncharacterized protein n=1 Tax=Ranitomeya imitator TaxID=111125 RepID=UPI0037E981F3